MSKLLEKVQGKWIDKNNGNKDFTGSVSKDLSVDDRITDNGKTKRVFDKKNDSGYVAVYMEEVI